MSMEKEGNERTVLVAIAETNDAMAVTEIELDELARLVKTAGGATIARMIQIKSPPDTATYLGKGKLEELRVLCENEEAELVVFNGELSPSQIRNIEEALGGPSVCDRTMLILDIFALHAVTGEGKLQVELAQLKYTAPRLIGKGAALSRQEGRIGTRGPGESKLESDRRHLHRRAVALEEQLKALAATRTTMRAARERSGIPKAAIVGYTNAGKSTLLNSLTDAGVLSEDKLFATLDPTTRRLSLPDGQEILLTDTVGFIRRLPHQLIRAFHSTLEEAALADILLIVCDVSDPECAEQLNVTRELLRELGAGDIPQLLVYNKCDLAASYTPEEYNTDPDHRVFLSAKDGRGIPDLLEAVARLLRGGKREVELLLPYDRAGLLNRLRGDCHFTEEPEYLDTGIRVKVLLDAKNYNKFQEFISGQEEI